MIDVVGIGAQGWQSLGASERQLLIRAATVLGGPRHLDLLPPVAGQERVPWPRDLRAALPALVAGHEQHPVAVLASGDPLVYGVGGTLLELFGSQSVRVHPHVSSVALAAARMGWVYGSYDVVRVTTPELDGVRRHLAPGQRLIILSRDAATPGQVQALLGVTGFGASEVTVLADLGSDRESRQELAADVVASRLPDLNLVCVTCRPLTWSESWSTLPGLAEEMFGSDGQLTKRDVRASALAHLRPVPGQLLWDVGAGAGSVGIEWARTHPRCRCIAVERDPWRAQRITANAARLGVPHVQVVTGEAPAALAGLPEPDAVFVGGGATLEVINRCWEALAPGGRLVAHAVTAETEAVVLEGWRRWGGGLTRLSVETMEPIGSYSGWKPARAVVQWSVHRAAHRALLGEGDA